MLQDSDVESLYHLIFQLFDLEVSLYRSRSKIIHKYSNLYLALVQAFALLQVAIDERKGRDVI